MRELEAAGPGSGVGRAGLRAWRALTSAVSGWVADDCGQRAAAIAYYALLSFFPFVILLGSVASVLVGDDAEEIRRALEPLRPLLPELGPGFWDRVQDLVDRRGLLSAGSLLGLVFLATRVTVSVQRALRAIFRAPASAAPRRHALTRWLVAHGMTIAALVAFGLVLTSIALLEVVVRASGSPAFVRHAVRGALFTRHAVPLIVLTGLGHAMFSLVPEARIRRRWRLLGGLFFAVSHDVAVSSWARIVGALSPRDLVYGSFVGAVSFAAWTWVVASLLLLAAELVAQLNGDLKSAPPSAGARRGRGLRRRTA